MGFPEIHVSSVKSLPWQPQDGVLAAMKRFHHMPSYQEFFCSVFLRNQLCILGPEATAEWASRKLWVQQDGSPDFTYMEENFGEAVAPVADCSGEEFCSHPKIEMQVKDYLEHWQTQRIQGHPKDSKCLYLKDWHFSRHFPSYCAYTTPDLLCSDWMNEFWDMRKDEKTDDYRFVYMGPKHSWTPFHADVLRSYSWSANICGQKKWIFYPPGEEQALRDRFGQLVFDLRSEDLRDSEKYPLANMVADKAITVIQNPGEIIFVPSGWHHQVFNMEDTISINHNWMNGCSAHLSWEFIKNQLAAVQKEIADCEDMDGWHNQCQVILKADSGMDYPDFYNFMATIASHRLDMLQAYLDLLNVGKQAHQEGAGDLQQSGTSADTTSVNDQLNGRDVESNNEEVLDKDVQTLPRDAGRYNKNVQFNSQDKETHNDEVQAHTEDFGLELQDYRDLQSMCYCLCLYKKEVFVTLTHQAGNCEKTTFSERSCGRIEGLRDRLDDNGHLSCPHWAHCGPSLAVFDLHRVLDIVQDMQEQKEFVAVTEDETNSARLLMTCPALIEQIENVIGRFS